MTRQLFESESIERGGNKDFQSASARMEEHNMSVASHSEAEEEGVVHEPLLTKIVREDKINNLPPVTRRFALFVDGMARALILPFGPSLVYRLVYNGDNYTSIPPVAEGGVAYYFAVVVSVYIFGRWLGSNIVTSKFCEFISLNQKHDKLPVYVARLGGCALALHIFTYGAGLASVRWLVAIRFLSAILAGLLCGITQSIALPEDDWVYRTNYNGIKINLFSEEEKVEALRRREGYIDIASGTAKIYLTGFAVSILSGGLLFRKATKDSTFRALTGAYTYSLSPMFLVAVALTADFVLWKIFTWAASQSSDSNPQREAVLENRSKIDSNGRKRTVSINIPHFQGSTEKDGGAELGWGTCNTSNGMITSQRTRLDSFLSADGHGTARSRAQSLNSLNSIDEFFDCYSVISGVEDGFSVGSPTTETDVEVAISDCENDIAYYKEGKTIYGNGSPAFVPQGDRAQTIPPNYLEFYKGNEKKAREAWETTQRWRRDQNVWRIHTMPNRWFSKIKTAYPHFVHGHSKAGYPIIYEQPGRMNLKELFRNGCGVSDMVWHYTFFMEFVSNRICTLDHIRAKYRNENSSSYQGSSTWGTMVVMDIKSVSLSALSGDVLKYLKQAGEINSAHYPNSMKRAFLVNSPFWVAGAWSGIKGILPDSVQVDILSGKNYLSALRQYIDDDQIPKEYGGSSPFALGEHPYEVELRQLVEKVAEAEKNECVMESKLHTDLLESSMIQTVADHKESNEKARLIPQISKATISPSGPKHCRRRANSVDTKKLELNGTKSMYNASFHTADRARGKDVFMIVSGMHVLFSFVQGAMEMAIPLWVLSPSSLGGLGYSPLKSGVSLFCAALVLLWSLRSKSSRLVSKIPSREPLRAFRIGAGSESALLALLCYSSAPSPSATDKDSVFLMASTIILFACMGLATMLGRTASKILHRIAAESFGRRATPREEILTSTGSKQQPKKLTRCESGQFTTILNISAEIAGIFAAAPLWSLSMSSGKQAPVKSTCILFVCSLISFLLYVCSFALHLNSAGEFAPHPKATCTDSHVRKLLSFIGEVVAISAGDMASLFEEANWTSSTLLGRSRARTFSELSAVSISEIMERGDPESHVRKAE